MLGSLFSVVGWSRGPRFAFCASSGVATELAVSFNRVFDSKPTTFDLVTKALL